MNRTQRAFLLPFFLLMLLGPTAGSANMPPGYADDRKCSICHSDIAKPYQEVGMSKAFSRPREDRFIEDFTENKYYHEPSNRHYEMVRDGETLTFRRYQLDDTGERINVFERQVDWMIGSGHKSRVYLIQEPSGTLFQLPIAWYTQTNSWGMSPGYDNPLHEGIGRQVRRGCMGCHNSYPDMGEGGDIRWASQDFPLDLPEGTGCQRCHGPSAGHVDLAIEHLGAAADDEEIAQKLRDSVVNPGRLSPERRDDVCDQCHFQSSVVLASMPKLDRGEFGFRPGEVLADYRIPLDFVAEGEEPGERFEINHHAYRLRQSTCFQESGRDLSCLTCHDPHRKVPVEQREAHYRTACQSCHQLDDCQLADMEGAPADGGDCVACHMPQRRPMDVVRTVMTDHRITRQPEPEEERIAPRAERSHILTDVIMLPGSPTGEEGQIYRAFSVLRLGPSAAALDFLERRLEIAEPGSLLTTETALLDIANAQLQLQRFDRVEQTAARILAVNPGHRMAREWRALAWMRTGNVMEALADLEKLTVEEPDRSEVWYNLGVLRNSLRQHEEAIPALRRAIESRPTTAAAHFQLGRSFAALDRNEEAVKSWQQTLAIDPTHTQAYMSLGETYLKLGQRQEALRWWRHGVGHARHPDGLKNALATEAAVHAAEDAP